MPPKLDELHVLLLPEGLREEPPLPGEEEHIVAYGQVVQNFNLRWERVDWKKVSADETRECLLDLVALPLANDQSKAVWALIEKWGIMFPGFTLDGKYGHVGLDPASLDTPAFNMFSQWIEFANEVRAVLITLAETLEGRLVDESLLSTLVRYGHTLIDDDDDEGSVSDDVMMGFFDNARADGNGLMLQRDLVAEMLNHRRGIVREVTAVWDDLGRRLIPEAVGVEEVVMAHVRATFLAAQPDIFECSICGKIFDYDEAKAQRRPRRGAQRFCSDFCRAEAARQQNLKKWHKYKDRYRQKNGGTHGKEEGSR